ncbi:MAG: 16S rRNA (guanine(527)-N(7))-methyltransferase RsmG [Sphingomicrobium sp.]
MNLDLIAGRHVPRETLDRLRRYETLVRQENDCQNLVGKSTLADFLVRHVADSLQLLRSIPVGFSLCDIGSGAGLPGVVIAAMGDNAVTLVEPRRLRAEFLRRVVSELELESAVVEAKAANARGIFDVITARAVAPLADILAFTQHLSHAETIWVLPKGRRVDSELEVLHRSWQCDVGEVSSVTDPDARIITLRHVQPKVGR